MHLISQTCGHLMRWDADAETRRSKSSRLALLQTPSKKFKGDSRYTGSDNEDDFNDFTMNKGFIQYDL